MPSLPRKIYSSGQALLLVLLSMAVVLTVVLSILARSVTDISITTQDEESLRAFSAAEAGVEKALLAGSSQTGTVGEANYSTSVTSFAEGLQEFVYPIALTSGESATIWFVAHDTAGNLVCSEQQPCFKGESLKVCWGKAGTSALSDTTPAIEVTVYYTAVPGDYTTARVARETIDPNVTRRAGNYFSAPDSGTCKIGETTFEFQKTLTFSDLNIPAASYGASNGLQFARIRAFYNTDTSHQIGVSTLGTGTLPAEGVRIESSGTSGEANRKLDVFQSFGESPSIFDSAIFSPPGITK